MAFKGLLKGIKDEVGRQIDKKLHPNQPGGHQQQQYYGGGPQPHPGFGGGGGSHSPKVDMTTLQGILGMLGGFGNKNKIPDGGGYGGGGGSGGNKNKGVLSVLNGLVNTIQTKTGGYLPGTVGRYLPGVLKVAELISHGAGDDSPRKGHRADGTIMDDFVKTIIGGRKIYGGRSAFHHEIGRPDGRMAHPTPGYSPAASASQGQEYFALKQMCSNQGRLFEDPEFPADESSLYFSKRGGRNFRWMRPHEICQHPSFFVEGVSRFDVKQGELGDCWLLAAVANLTLYPVLFQQVVPSDNSFDYGYAGIFHFRFWQYGRWVDVVVDDRLPTDSSGKLMFMHSASKNEFWSALLEKAYAKLHGSYEALKGGTTCEALADFTGGVTEIYNLQSVDMEFFYMMMRAHERSSLLGCSIEPDANVFEAETYEGLVRGHAYSITSVKLVDITTQRRSGKIPLIRIRNPWGNHKEWKGPWSDGSEEWRFIDRQTKEELGLTFDPDGEFWMSFSDFVQYFDQLEICNLSPDSPHEAGMKTWSMNLYEGVWEYGRTAGGCRNYIESFASNPQYVVDLEETDSEGKCTVIIAVMQKNRRALKHLGGVETLTIGFAVYKIGSSDSPPLSREFFKYNASTARSPTFINLREVSSRFKLGPGRYVVIPSTFEPGEEGEFIIRVFTEGRKVAMREYGGGAFPTSPSMNYAQPPPPQPTPTTPAFGQYGGYGNNLPPLPHAPAGQGYGDWNSNPVPPSYTPYPPMPQSHFSNLNSQPSSQLPYPPQQQPGQGPPRFGFERFS